VEEIAIGLGITPRYARRLISESLSSIRTIWGIVLPVRSDGVTDGWWPLVLESLRLHADVSQHSLGPEFEDDSSGKRCRNTGISVPR
jgi:hypothetical protein